MAEVKLCFSRLPKELPQEIWAAALAEPSRVIHVELTCHEALRQSGDKSLPRLALRYVDQSYAPALLRTNHESRQMALEVYKKCYEGPSNGKKSTIYIRPTDSLLVNMPKMTRSNLAVVHDLIEYYKKSSAGGPLVYSQAASSLWGSTRMLWWGYGLDVLLDGYAYSIIMPHDLGKVAWMKRAIKTLKDEGCEVSREPESRRVKRLVTWELACLRDLEWWEDSCKQFVSTRGN